MPLRRWLRRPAKGRAVFLHVPKCGGTSLRVALREAFNPPGLRRRRHHFHLSPYRSHHAAEGAGLDTPVARDALLRYAIADRDIRVATGHFRWPEGLREVHPGLAFLTLLRDPVEHFLSSYFFRREDRGERQVHSETADLTRFLASERAVEAGAQFVRYFLPAGDPTKIDADAIERAAMNLESVEVLGVLEDLPAFAKGFERHFGAPLHLPRANAGTLRQAAEQDEVTDAHRDHIRELVRPNQALYDRAVGEIERRA